MKITKNYIKQLVKEELSSLTDDSEPLQENEGDMSLVHEELRAQTKLLQEIRDQLQSDAEVPGGEEFDLGSEVPPPAGATRI
jgi:hypothetical protein